MRKILALLLIGIIGSAFVLKTNNQHEKMDFYSFTFTDISGNEFDFATLKGKRVLLVNTASECGYTPQYKQLQELYETYNQQNFVIIGFPANNFGKQEPGSNTEIEAFCQKNYGVSFLLMEKSDVTGENQNSVYQWLTQKAKNGVSDAKVSWNFNKFLIDENGNWVAHFPSSVSPLDEKIIDFIEAK